MKIRYLYGKAIYLDEMIDGKCGIRFSDLSHYSRLENEKMRDDEMKKIFILPKNEVVIEINGYKVNADDLASDTVLSTTPRHCYCLCLSSRGDDDELYRIFKADTCIAFDVDELERRLSVTSDKFKGSFITGKDIIYYSITSANGLGQSREELVFYKPDAFSHEAEYRIAWFYPLNKKGFSSGGITIPFIFKDESSHITFFHKEKTIITDCIEKVYRKKLITN
jgi:hypothetical protein